MAAERAVDVGGCAYAKLGSACPGATGRIAYTRSYGYRQSAVQLAGMSLYTLVLSATTWRPTVLGGGIGLALLAFEHARRSAALAPAISGASRKT
jgi:hypothetical protein